MKFLIISAIESSSSLVVCLTVAPLISHPTIGLLTLSSRCPDHSNE